MCVFETIILYFVGNLENIYQLITNKIISINTHTVNNLNIAF